MKLFVFACNYLSISKIWYEFKVRFQVKFQFSTKERRNILFGFFVENVFCYITVDNTLFGRLNLNLSCNLVLRFKFILKKNCKQSLPIANLLCVITFICLPLAYVLIVFENTIGNKAFQWQNNSLKLPVFASHFLSKSQKWHEFKVRW